MPRSNIFRRRKKEKLNGASLFSAKARLPQILALNSNFGYSLINSTNDSLFKKMRNSIPVIDAALEKIEKLIGGFSFKCENKEAEIFLNSFRSSVKVGQNMVGMENFIKLYLDNLLTFGSAVGEIVFDDEQKIKALYNANLENVVITSGEDPLDIKICGKNYLNQKTAPIDPKKILFTALNPKPGEIKGESILKSLPFVSNILINIYDAIGKNFERLGNLRFAIVYKPGENEIDRAYAKERTETIANEWVKGINSSKNGEISDFITFGDVEIKAIGADNHLIDCQIPVKQLLEQIIAKLEIPPFVLGLSWSVTERMCDQQAKFFMKTLKSYRRSLEPTITKIATTALRLEGYFDMPKIIWEAVNFSDKIKEGKARLYNAQAERIELENKKTKLQYENKDSVDEIAAVTSETLDI